MEVGALVVVVLVDKVDDNGACDKLFEESCIMFVRVRLSPPPNLL